MKKIFIQMVFLAALMLPAAGPGRAADVAGNAAAVAAQQEAEERSKRLTATIEEMQALQALQHQKIAALTAELGRVREEIAKVGASAAGTDSLKRLADQIQDVDRKRVADNERIQAEFVKLARAISAAPGPAPQHHVPAPSTNSTPVLIGEGFEHPIAKGDTLGAVVQAYRDQGIKVTRKMVQDANPNVNWDKLVIGRKIFIPKPK